MLNDDQVDANCVTDADADEAFVKDLRKQKNGRGWLQNLPFGSRRVTFVSDMSELEVAKRGIRRKF